MLSRCPVFITDTVSVNNFFIEARPATLKVYRVRGDLTIVIEQREQFFSLFFMKRGLGIPRMIFSPVPREGER